MFRYGLFLALMIQCIVVSTAPINRFQSLYLVNAAQYAQYPQLGEKTVDTLVRLLFEGVAYENYPEQLMAYAACDYVPKCIDKGRFGEQFIQDVSDGVHDGLLAAIKQVLNSTLRTIGEDELWTQ